MLRGIITAPPLEVNIINLRNSISISVHKMQKKERDMLPNDSISSSGCGKESGRQQFEGISVCKSMPEEQRNPQFTDRIENACVMIDQTV
jgi:hypothetical protein